MTFWQYRYKFKIFCKVNMSKISMLTLNCIQVIKQHSTKALWSFVTLYRQPFLIRIYLLSHDVNGIFFRMTEFQESQPLRSYANNFPAWNKSWEILSYLTAFLKTSTCIFIIIEQQHMKHKLLYDRPDRAPATLWSKTLASACRVQGHETEIRQQDNII